MCVFFVRLLEPIPVEGKQIVGQWPFFITCWMCPLYNSFVLWTAIDPAWKQQKRYRRRLYIEEVTEALIKPHISKRRRLPRSSSAADIVMDAQSADAGAPGPAPIQTKCRRQCQLCTDKRRRIVSTCSKCEKPACKDHCMPICSLCFK